MNEKLYTMAEAAKSIGITMNHLSVLRKRGQAPEPIQSDPYLYNEKQMRHLKIWNNLTMFGLTANIAAVIAQEVCDWRGIVLADPEGYFRRCLRFEDLSNMPRKIAVMIDLENL